MEFFNKVFSQIKEVLAKLDNTKKIIVGVVGLVLIISFAVLISVSKSTPYIVLFSDLTVDDFGKITKELESMGFRYNTATGDTVLVHPGQREIILTRLAQEDMIPRGIPGWKLFDVSRWTETEKELDVKYMRALRGEVTRHIESLRNIEKATVEIAMTDDSIYADVKTNYTAAVTVFLAPGYDQLSKKEVRGITHLVSRAVGTRLMPEHVTVTDSYGRIISDFDDDFERENQEYTIIENRRRIEERVRARMLMEIREGLENIYTPDRIQVVRLNMDFDWDKIEEQQEEFSPVVMVPDDPRTPFSERQVQESIVRSKKNVQEMFEGHGWNPQGPAGTEGNVPPGYKASDDQRAKYHKDEYIENYEINRTKRNIVRQPYSINRVSVAIAIDGRQDLPRRDDGSYDLDPFKDPVQIPLAPDEMRKAENIVRKAINFDLARGDQVAVENIMFDRTAHWNRLREEYRQREQFKRLVLAALIGVVALFVGFILFRVITREVERRRRMREEQLALEQQRMREAALRAAEEEGVDIELSLEEKARLELQNNAVNLARERPDDVAQLLRTWLAEE